MKADASIHTESERLGKAAVVEQSDVSIYHPGHVTVPFRMFRPSSPTDITQLSSLLPLYRTLGSKGRVLHAPSIRLSSTHLTPL